MAKLTTAHRKNLLKQSKSNFVFPGKGPGAGSYPINDPEHGRKALQLGAKFASPSQLATIKRKVHAKFPSIGHRKNLLKP